MHTYLLQPLHVACYPLDSKRIRKERPLILQANRAYTGYSPYSSIMNFRALTVRPDPFFLNSKRGRAILTPETRRVLHCYTVEQYIRVPSTSLYSSAVH